MAHARRVTMEWIDKLPMQQQSVLLLGLRGPDGLTKHHRCKPIVRHYRACIIKAAYFGRSISKGAVPTDSFMSMEVFYTTTEAGVTTSITEDWLRVCKLYFDGIDELPLHYHLHVMHGAEILGYKHPDKEIAACWYAFYLQCCDAMHVNPETREQMDIRLGDWGQEHWD